jgi:hypothetical protein
LFFDNREECSQFGASSCPARAGRTNVPF